jgi:flavin-dependent dehydrogenase
MGGPMVETRYDHPVGYGIRRYEFDQYLVERAGVWLQDGEELSSLERTDDGWIINKGLRASVIVGAGGHLCPVAQHLGAKPAAEPVVVAKDVEYAMDEALLAQCAIEPEIPELYFFPDMKGYGWCFHKGNYINFGLRRMDRAHFSGHLSLFLNLLRDRNKIPGDMPSTLEGQSYLRYGPSTRQVVGDRALLVGDAAGLAYDHSGEGIRPAIESGLLAARTLLDARGDYSLKKLEPYRARLVQRFGSAKKERMHSLWRIMPERFRVFLARRLLASIRFSRDVLLNRWFLHVDEPALLY